MAKMVPVKSSMLEAIGYDAPAQVLTVRFRGSPYVHSTLDVPAEVHAEVMAADSIGQAYNRLIRGKFTPGSQTRVTDDEPVTT